MTYFFFRNDKSIKSCIYDAENIKRKFGNVAKINGYRSLLMNCLICKLEKFIIAIRAVGRGVNVRVYMFSRACQ